MNVSEPLRRYCSHLYRLHAIVANGFGESDEAEELREVMDTDWFYLAEVERGSVRYLSQYFSQTLFGSAVDSYSVTPLRYFMDAVVDQNAIAAIHFLPLGAQTRDWKSAVAVGELMKGLILPDVRTSILQHILGQVSDGRLFAYWALSDHAHFATRFSTDGFYTLARSMQRHLAESAAAEAAFSFFSHSPRGHFAIEEHSIASCIAYFDYAKDRTRTAAEGVFGLIPLYMLRKTPKTAEFAAAVSRKYPWSELEQEPWWSTISGELESENAEPQRVGNIMTAIVLNYARREL